MSDQTQGDRQSWVADALARHESGLIRYALRLCGDENTARDAVQETFLNMCAQDPAKLDGRLTPWLYTVCRNRVLDQIRRRKREQPSGDRAKEMADRCTDRGPGSDMGVHAHTSATTATHQSASRSTATLVGASRRDRSDPACDDSDPARAAVVKEAADQVLSMLNDLPANQQNVLRLRFQGGLSYNEIAEVTELSVTNVGFLMHTAIKTIRARMTEPRP